MNRFRKLIWQLYPSYLLITLISLFAVSWYTLSSLEDFFLGQIEYDLQIRAKLIEKQIAGYLKPLSADSIDRLCKEEGKPAETRITVILPDGKVIGDSEEDTEKMENHKNRPEILDAINGKISASTRYSNTLNKKMMYVALPLTRNNAVEAVIRTSIPITHVYTTMKTIQTRIILCWLFIAVLASAVCLLISRRISLPIEEMKRGADRFSEGDLKHRLHEPSTSELAALARSMNRMARQLEDRMETVISQRNEYEAVLSSMTEGVMAVDNDDRILSANQAVLHILGIDFPNVKGRSIQEAVRNRALHKFMAETILSDAPEERDFILHTPDERIVNIRCIPLRNSTNSRIGTLIVLNDVTQIRRLELMRRDFAANVSHELKTPLTAIKGFVETLQQGTVNSPEDGERFLGIIEKHVNRLDAIIENLMDLSRIEQADGKNEIVFKEEPIAAVIDTAISLCQEKAKEKNIKMEFSGDRDISLKMDKPLLEQAFFNLLDNALKYSGKDSQILVNAAKTPQGVVVNFRDHGAGISQEHLPRLFERFYRVDKARSRKLGGTGLGLAIVKHIVQAHGGSISVESTPGKGSTFSVRLPLLQVSLPE